MIKIGLECARIVLAERKNKMNKFLEKYYSQIQNQKQMNIDIHISTTPKLINGFEKKTLHILHAFHLSFFKSEL